MQAADNPVAPTGSASIGHNRPPAAPTPRRTYCRTCGECGGKFQAKRVDASFCTPEHKLAFHNRAKGRSAAIAYAMAWRGGRGQNDVAKLAYAEFCRLLDRYNAEDRAAGRPSAQAYVASLDARQMVGLSTDRLD